MKINSEVFEKAEKVGSEVLVVTKYFDVATTKEIFGKVKDRSCFLGLGENRSEVLAKKGILRDRCHFIGNIQSRKIGEIGEFCSVIHSLDSLSHARKFMKAGDFTSFFIQINLDPTKSSGVDPQLIPEFLKIIPEDRVLGISAIGKGDFTIPEKINEFKELKKIRDTYLPGKKISAGTSRDFEIALSEGIEIVRVGQALFN